MKPSDIVIAATPPVATLTLGSINEVLGFVGGLVSIGYLIWKWQDEARNKKD